jgi:hypothetical protein
MKKKTVFLLVIFLFIHSNVYARPPLHNILIKHGLVLENERYHWEALALKENNYNLLSSSSQIKLINLVSADTDKDYKHKDTSMYLRHKAARSVLKKYSKIFMDLITLTDTYDEIVRDMDLIHQKASRFYNVKTSTPEEAAKKKTILKKAKKSYKSLRRNAVKIYMFGTKTESVLAQLSEILSEAYSLQDPRKDAGPDFAYRYGLDQLKLNGLLIEDALQKILSRTDEILKESEVVYMETLKDIDLQFNNE